MRMVIIIVVALLIIGGGGAGAYFYMQPKAIEGEEVAQLEEQVEEHNDSAAYVEMDPFMLSVLGKNKAHFTVSIAVVLEVKSDSYIDDVDALSPKLNHYFLEELYDSMGKEIQKV